MGLDFWELTKEYLYFYINKILPSIINFIVLNFNNDIYIFMKNTENIVFCLKFFKFNSLLKFNFFCDLVLVDFFFNKIRYKVLYNLINLFFGFRIFINVFLKNSLCFLSSISKIYCSAGWAEREAWDMFGIFFVNNTSLKRILTDYGFKGHPLKKDFPLLGYVELYYNTIIGETIYKPVELSQEYRFYSIESNWEY